MTLSANVNSDNYLGFDHQGIETSVVARFERIAEVFALRVAITSQGRRITYERLNQKANQLAHLLVRSSPDSETPVTIVLDHDIPIIIAILGILKAGRAYVVLDPTAPQRRLADIVEEVDPHVIVSNKDYTSITDELVNGARQVITLDGGIDDSVSTASLGQPIESTTLAGIFYTSGSTGRPKGVQRQHREILQRIWQETTDFHINADDNVALLYFCGFGSSTTDLFNALLNGATLCLYDFRQEGLLGLADWLQREAITLFHLPIALFQQWLDTLSPQDYFAQVRVLTPSGKLYRRDVERSWQHFSPHLQFVQRFASTEAGLCTRIIFTPDAALPDSPVIPVGYPFPDKEVLLLDDADQPTHGPGTGQIVIKSRYLSPGYWRNETLTRNKFIPDPDDPQIRLYFTGDQGRRRADGCLEFLGRADNMVKIRGYRVEPAEVETALRDLDCVSQATVIAQTESGKEPCLVAYVVPRDSNPRSQTQELPRELNQALRQVLPDYLVPAAYVILPELPLTPNGKI
ncbi:MAG: amino acid adenylation domain-containing protein, partial [Cyanobacteria bacterium P01_H01_bin.15]